MKTTNKEDRLVDKRQAPDIVVDRGQPVIIEVHMICDDDPDEVNFDYTRPGSDRPYVDDGYGQPRSKIVRLEKGVYRYIISTKGFDAGEGVWHMTGEWDRPVAEGYTDTAIFGLYRVNDWPRQL